MKVGIMADLLAHAEELGLSERELKNAIKVWCRGSRYWSCLVEGAPRVDLSGKPVGEVTSADAVRARQLQRKRSPRTTASVSTTPKSDG